MAQPRGVHGRGDSERLADRSDVTVVARPPDPDAPYDYSALDLNGAELRVAEWPRPFSFVDELIERTQPDIVCGIDRNGGVLRALHRARRRHGTTTVMVADYDWSGAWRQRVLQTLLTVVRPYAFDAAFVPGRGAPSTPDGSASRRRPSSPGCTRSTRRASPRSLPAAPIVSRIRASCSAVASFLRKPRTSWPMRIGSTPKTSPTLGLCRSLGMVPLTAVSPECPVCA